MSVNAEAVAANVEAILDQMSRTVPDALELAEDLVRELMGLYGAGLERVLDRLGAADAGALADLTSDPLVAGLMALHDLHPVDLETRVQGALEQVRPYLGSHGGGVRLLGIEGEVVHLELQGSCDGCGSSAITVQYAVEGAIRDAAPEIARVEVAATEAAPAGLNLIDAESLLRKPAGAGAQPADVTPDWTPLSLSAPLEADVVTGHSVDGAALVMIRRDGRLLAYRDDCAECGSSLVGGALDGDVLACPECARAFDVRLAGRALDGDLTLVPVPLLEEEGGVRVAAGALR